MGDAWSPLIPVALRKIVFQTRDIRDKFATTLSLNNQNKPALVNQMGTYTPHVEDNANPIFTKSRVNEQPLRIKFISLRDMHKTPGHDGRVL